MFRSARFEKIRNSKWFHFSTMKGNARFAFRHFSTTFDEENRGNLLRYLAIFRQRIAKINLKYKSIYYSISDPWKFEFGYFSNVFDLKKKEVWNLNFAFLFFLNYDENKSQAERPKESFIIFIYFHLWKFKFKFKLTFFNKSSTQKIHGYFQIIFSFVSLKNWKILPFSNFFSTKRKYEIWILPFFFFPTTFEYNKSGIRSRS